MATLEKDIADFVSHCRHEKKLSDKTLKCYQIDLTQFVRFFVGEDEQINVDQIDKSILRRYLHTITDYKPKTIKRKIASLKAFFNFMEFEDKITVNPFRKIRFQVREPKRLPTVMTQLEVKKIFQTVYSSKIDAANMSSYRKFEIIRNIAVIELLFATGVRVSELSYLKQDNIDLEAGFIKVIGKGNKERIIQICNREMVSTIYEYSNLAKNYRDVSTKTFFVNRLGNQLSDQSIRSIVKNVSKAAAINKHITPHIFRHSLATQLLEEGVDIKYIQIILGHSSIMTTQIYTHVNGEKQKAILTDKHPRRKFSMSENAT